MKELVNQVKQLLEDRERFRKIAVMVLLILIIGIAFAAKNADTADRQIETDTAAEEIEDDDTKASETIYVDIGGAVNEPMLAELPRGSRVEDAITAAGGLTDKADLTSINRAEFLEDGEKIYIPELAENGFDAANGGIAGSNATADGDSSGSESTSAAAGGRININTADSVRLQKITGVGPATAQKIIDYRTSNGRFKTIEDIKNVSGIGDKTFEKMKDQITT